MAVEISTLALNVDLDCHPCYQQMTKALCKFPEIQSQKFDEEQKKVIISGPFEPEKLIKKLCCKVGCKIIKGYVIILEQPKPAPPKPKPDESKPQPKPDKTPSKPVPLVPGPSLQWIPW
ncbi:protein PYRICULARIA ORYZAE RESISTANCE 21-like [Magnolia sinica]|uniref:protein PYRICULARIA ORYZAE RESISTANCE 21-like n=1 Tax=Magnolia sinica TaxID=86752 RepID=UPI0026584393|nr:protein PYRICULARIA ORYZAE RESISTANCE 21-like [Magnolia sinica]